MPLNRPALVLGPGARSVQDARRWVGDACSTLGRADLVECAELGVSELVTNALLHADPPYLLQVSGTDEHPRVEVCDGTPEPPVLPERPADEHGLLLTFGRGLGIVARCSQAWGVDVGADGKAVWFSPAPRPSDRPAPGTVSGPAHDRVTDAANRTVEVLVLGVPLRDLRQFERHYRELRREVRLLALAHEDDYPLAKDLSDLFGTLERDLRQGIDPDQVAAALASGREVVDLHVRLPSESAASIEHFLRLLDLADSFCRQERLLSLERTPEQREFQRWFLGELVQQQRGRPPVAWHDATVTGQQSNAS